MNLNFNDFQKQDVKFDIDKLQKAYNEILAIKGFTGVDGISNFGAISLTQIPGDPDSIKGFVGIDGISNFGAISLTQIPGDPESIKGHKARGVFWTKPDSSGKEAMRDEMINEAAYSEFIDDYKETYFKEVFDVLSSKYKLGRVRVLLKEPRSTLSWHRDPEPRLHIPIITNPGSIMVIDNVAKHMPADGSVWITNNTKYHNAFNGGEENRIHLVACVLDYKFN